MNVKELKKRLEEFDDNLEIRIDMTLPYAQHVVYYPLNDYMTNSDDKITFYPLREQEKEQKIVPLNIENTSSNDLLDNLKIVHGIEKD